LRISRATTEVTRTIGQVGPARPGSGQSGRPAARRGRGAGAGGSDDRRDSLCPGFLCAFALVCNAGCNVPTFTGGDRLTPISRLSAAYCVELEPRPLPPTGVTRSRRYYGPLRHPRRPGLSLAGIRSRVTRPHRSGFPELRWISVSRHAVVMTPVAR